MERGQSDNSERKGMILVRRREDELEHLLSRLCGVDVLAERDRDERTQCKLARSWKIGSVADDCVKL
jgi:hypothetical protein